MNKIVDALQFTCVAFGYLLFAVAAVIAIFAAPFAYLGIWVFLRADDLEAGWRRGRKQNWLWRWAHRARNYPT